MPLDLSLAFLAGLLAALLGALPAGLVVRRLLRELSVSRSALEDAVRSLQDDRDAERQELLELVTTLAELRYRNDALQSERDQWAAASTAHETAAADWKKRCEGVVQKHNYAVGKYREVARKHNDLVDRLQALTQERDQLGARERSLQEELEASLEKAQALERQLETLEQGRQELEREKDDLTQTNRQLGEESRLLADRVEGLQEQKRNLEHQRDELAGQRDQALQAIRNLERVNEQANRRSQGLEETKRELGLELEKERSTTRTLRGELEALARSQETLERTKIELTDRLQEQATLLEQLRGELEELSRTNEGLARTNADLTREVDDLHGAWAESEKEKEKLLQELQRLRLEYAELQDRLRGFEDESQLPPLPPLSMERPIGFASTWSPAGTVNIGLDFGTHSTKAILRNRNEEQSLVLELDDPTEGYPSFASPSLVCLSGGRLFFGARALQVPGGQLFRSLKVDLLPPSVTGDWEPGVFPPGTTPDLLVACYLSWVFARIKEAINKKGTPRVLCNVAAPMNHLEDAGLKERYLHVVHAAWRVAFEGAPPVSQGAGLNRLRSTFQPLLDSPVPGPEVLPFEVFPETLAPLVSLFQNPRARHGHYMMIDMGAGTTELSVSIVNSPSGSISCYRDESILLGGDDFRRNDQRNSLGSEAHTTEEERLRTELRKTFKRVWSEAFLLESGAGPATRNRWRQLSVILSGGGLRRTGLPQLIADNTPLHPVFQLDPIEYTVDWHRPARLVFTRNEPGSPLADPEHALAYLAVAHGLSVERGKWPPFHYPKDIPPLLREVIQSPEFSYILS